MNRRDVFRSAIVIVSTLAMTALPLTAADQAGDGKSPSKDQVRATVLRYVAAWGERDPKRRLDLVAHTWVEHGTYIDHARQAEDHDNISAMIAKAQEPLPGYGLALASGIELHHDYVRFSWVAGGTPEAPLYIKGTDIATVAADGRFKSVIGFIDAAP